MLKNILKKFFPLSVKVYAMGFTIVSFLLLISFLWFNFNKVNELQDKMNFENSILAKKELNQAISKSIQSAKNIATQLENWDETIQQLHNPVYYTYWRRNRALEAPFIENYFIALEIYNKNGNSISDKKHFPLLPSMNDSTLGSFVAKNNENLTLYFSLPIKESTNASEHDGYLAIELDLAMLLNDVQRFKLISSASLNFQINKNGSSEKTMGK